MSLGGKIEVNGEPVGWWYARRIDGGTNPDDRNTYDASVHTGRLPDVLWDWRGVVEHRYGDGACVLASKVLSAAVSGVAGNPEGKGNE